MLVIVALPKNYGYVLAKAMNVAFLNAHLPQETKAVVSQA